MDAEGKERIKTGFLEGRPVRRPAVLHTHWPDHCVLLSFSRNTLPDEDIPCSACARAEASATWSKMSMVVQRQSQVRAASLF
jgi:hypothetical protein